MRYIISVLKSFRRNRREDAKNVSILNAMQMMVDGWSGIARTRIWNISVNKKIIGLTVGLAHRDVLRCYHFGALCFFMGKPKYKIGLILIYLLNPNLLGDNVVRSCDLEVSGIVEFPLNQLIITLLSVALA